MTTYTVLARKWRPKAFAEMVGQQTVVDALERALTLQRLHHAYLFTGTRGVGKTTVARILAKCLCCEQQISPTPCNTCSTCKEIDAGCYPELIEVDAASRTRVEETRELLDNVAYLPTRGRFKIYLIDEVHMLSMHSFNALLKTLEEPPEHVKFLFATTDPQKLPATILSRCLQYHLKPVQPAVITAHLQKILQQEQVTAEVEALQLIANSAQGSLRDALSLLDQAIAYGAGHVTTSATRAMLGLVAPQYIFLLLNAIAQRDGEQLLHHIETVAQEGFAFEALIAEMLTVLQRVATLQVVPTSKLEITYESEHRQLAQLITPEMAQLFYSIALMGRRDLTIAPDQRSAFEMVMLRMFAFMPAPVMPVAATPVTAIPVTATPVPEIKAVDPVSIIKAAVIDEKQPVVATPTPVKENPIAKEVPLPASSVLLNDRTWSEVIEDLKLVGITSALAKNSVLTGYQNNQIELALSTQHEPLYSDTQKDRIAQALTKYLGQPTQVRFTVGTLNQETPMIATQRVQQAAKQELIETMQNDAGVKELEKQFGAVLDIRSIEAVE
jgi:DNA polymerase-3 subunit gamma/tau